MLKDDRPDMHAAASVLKVRDVMEEHTRLYTFASSCPRPCREGSIRRCRGRRRRRVHSTALRMPAGHADL